MRAARWVAAVTAAVAWGGLALQYVILVKNIGPGLATWRFLGFFTILTNIGIAAVATGIALGRDNWLTGSRARLTGLTSIATVGLSYSLLLRSLWSPEGPQKLADLALHDATPILFVILWALMPHGQLKWRDLKWALVLPGVYFLYSMARGAVDGWFPYYFLDPTRQSPVQLAISIAGMLVGLGAIAGCAIAVDMRLGRRGT